MNYRLPLYIMIAIWPFGCVLGNGSIWQKELACDTNLGCSPGVVAADVKGNKLVILGAATRNDAGEGDFMLWEIDPNGNILNRTQLGEIPKESAAMPLSYRFRDIAIKNDNQITVLGDIEDGNTISPLLNINRKEGKSSMESVSNFRVKKGQKDNLILKMRPVSDNSQVFVGRRGTNAILAKIDDAGNELWEKTFDVNETELFSDVVTNDNKIYVVGYSGQVQGKMSFDANTVQNFLLLYNSDGQLLKEEYFKGTPFPTETPQICRLGSGIILVAYDKSKDVLANDLNVRAYNPDLKFLWETQVVKTEGGPPVSFRIIAVSGDKFFVGANINNGELVIAEYASNGKLMERWTLGKIVGYDGGPHLAELDEKVYVIFPTRSHGNFQNRKIKMLAFPIK